MTNSHDNINKTLQDLYNWITAAEIPGFNCLHCYLVMLLYVLNYMRGRRRLHTTGRDQNDENEVDFLDHQLMKTQFMK